MSDEGWRRLHPASVLVNLLPRMASAARAAWPLLLAWVYGRATGTMGLDLALLALFVVPSVTSTVLHWATLRYRVDASGLQIDSGWLRRTHRTLQRDAVQDVQVVRNVFHRLAGLAEVRIETASGREVEGLLSALSLPEAEALCAALRRPLPAGPSAAPVASAELAALGWQQVAWFAATSLRPATVTVGLLLAWQLLLERGGPSNPGGSVAEVASGAAPSLAIAVLVASGAFWVAAGTSYARHAGFRLSAEGDVLRAEEGLFTRRRTELRTPRIQIVTFEQSVVRRWLGFGALAIETAAGRPEGDGTERASTTVPFVPDAAAASLVQAVLRPAGDPASLVWRGPHPSAGWRAALPRAAAAAVGAGAAVLVGVPAPLAAVAVPVVAGLAWRRATAERWTVTDELLATRTGWWSWSTSLVPLRRVQSVVLARTPWLARVGLVRVAVRIAGRAIALPLMADAEAEDLRSRVLHPR